MTRDARQTQGMVPAARGPLLRALTIFAITLALASGLAYAVRYGLVERDDIGASCDGAIARWRCGIRMLFIQGFVHGIYGWGSVACAAVAAWRRSVAIATVAIGLGALGMVLYDFMWSGIGVIAGAVVLARASEEPRQQY